jgi:hypothetical protein
VHHGGVIVLAAEQHADVGLAQTVVVGALGTGTELAVRAAQRRELAAQGGQAAHGVGHEEQAHLHVRGARGLGEGERGGEVAALRGRADHQAEARRGAARHGGHSLAPG